MTNITTGRRTVPALSCSDNQLREIVARLQQSVEVLDNPAPAGAVNTPIAQGSYAGPIYVDFELTEPFTDGMADARTVQSDGTLFPVEPTPDPVAPTGSPIPPTTVTVCTWPGNHPSAIAGDRGHAVYKRKEDGTRCWWVIQIQPTGDPLGGPEGSFEFDDTLTDDSGGDDGEGDPTFNDHSSPHSGGFICFTASTVDHWVHFGDRGKITSTGMSWSGWFKGAHANADIIIVEKLYENDAGADVAEWDVTAIDAGGGSTFFRFVFVNGANFANSVGISVASDNGTWSDETWHHLAVSVRQNGNTMEGFLWVDGVEYTNSVLLTDDEAINRDQDNGNWMNANTFATPPVLGVTTGVNTYCLDNFRFWDDRILSSEEIADLYNEGVIE